MRISKFIYCITLLLCFGLLSGQRQIVNSELSEGSKDLVSKSNVYDNPLFPIKLSNALYDVKRNNFPFLQETKIVHKSYQATMDLSNIKTVLVNDAVSKILQSKFKKEISNEFSVEHYSLVNGNNRNVFAKICPYRFNSNGQIEELYSYTVNWKTEQSEVSTLKSASSSTFVPTSVLSSGTWYKIGIVKSGVYKMDKNFLTSLGINTATLNPKNLRLYGNGGKLLNQYNGNFRYDDLQENPIEVVGELDNVFDNTDYVLFYGQATNNWIKDTGNVNSCLDFFNVVHLYSDTNYYYLNTDLGAGKRIQTRSSSGLPITNNSSTYDYYDYHEKNTTNFIKSGSELYGEYFDLNTSYTFNYPIPNLVVGDTVKGFVKIAARSLNVSFYNFSFSGSSITFSANAVNVNDYLGDYVSLSSTCNKAICNNNNILSFNISKTTPGTVGWLDKIIFNCRRNLVFNNSQFNFRDRRTVGAGNITQFNINSNNISNISIWDVTDPINPWNQQFNLSGTNIDFAFSNDSLREFVIHNGSDYLIPKYITKVINQNLHAQNPAEYLIVTYPGFINQANRLAAIHQQVDGLITQVVTSDQIYNEFSSGKPDPTAIRDYVRMHYKKNKANGSELKYLLLFGDGSYKNKDRYASGNSAMLPALQTGYPLDNSWNPTLSTVCDDFYGWLDDTEGHDWGYALVDIGIGRFPVRTSAEAIAAVNKVEAYYKLNHNFSINESENLCATASAYPLGDWRNWVAFVADDEDYQIHMNDADQMANKIKQNHPEYNLDKIYSDAFIQYSTPGGQRYYDVTTAIDQRFDKGGLIVNYTGHGGEVGLGHERYLEVGQIQSYTNINNMPLFITATCEFSRFDDPDRTSAGEMCFLNPNGAAIALLTTVRLAFSNTNFTLNYNLYDFAFDTLPNGKMPALGDIVRLTKRKSGVQFYFLNFHLLGDPALTLAYPKEHVYTTHINNKLITATTFDTISALSKVTVKGFVGDKSGNKLNNFNGILNPTVFDKEQNISCLGNDPASVTTQGTFKFKQQKNIIYKGKVQVTKGDFSFTFIVPKDIAYNFDLGKISYYAQNGLIDANGYNKNIYVGGSATNVIPDNVGPTVSLYMNDKKFVSGGTTNEKPRIYAEVIDSSGVNTVGTGIGHDITAVLDENSSKPIILNDFYEADLNSYQTGKIKYPFNELSEGNHRLSLKVWDVQNNSSTAYTEFVVSKSAEMALTHVLNYPNPFTTRTEFYFENNQCCQTTKVNIQIFTITGKMVKTLSQTVTNEGFRSEGIPWDGKDEYGDKLGKGVYVYRLSISSEGNKKAEKTEKLVILN